MNVLYENNDIIVCQKDVGYVSELSDSKPSLANEILQKYGYAGIIHRLDMNVGGAILYAKNKKAAAFYSKVVADNQLHKEYLAVVHGIPDEKTGRFEDLLFKDSSKNKVFAVKRMRKGVKKASLTYELVETVYDGDKPISLVKITLQTGRSHQIRVQFSSRKMPLLGDGKYGSRDNKCDIALWSHRLLFSSIDGNTTHDIKTLPDHTGYPWSLFEFDKNS